VTPPNPDVSCTSADIQWPKAELDTGTRVKIRWTLLPEGCGLTDERNIEVQATAHNSGADPKKQNSNKRRVGQDKTAITIPHNCDWDPDPTMGTNIDSSVAIQYDFSALGEALGDSKAGTAYYTEKVNHQVGVDADNCDVTDTNPVVPYSQIVGPADEDLTTNADGSVTGSSMASVYTMAKSQKVSELSEPKWSTELSIAYMNIYITTVIDGARVNKRINIDPVATDAPYNVGTNGADGKYDSWAELQASEYRDYSVRTNYTERNKDGITEVIPLGSNFILRLGRTGPHGGPNWTLKSYSVNQ